jgi:CRP-like cAMP-binding protein
VSGPDQSSVANRVLRAVPALEFARIAPHLEPVELPQGKLLHQSGAAIDFVYFVESGFVSIVGVLNNAEPLELGIIGAEGVVGVATVLGAKMAFGDAMSQMSGDGLRISTEALRLALKRAPVLHAQLLRFSHALHVQVAQTAACNVRHDLTQRLARWLLSAQDRQGGDELPLTQNFLSMMLGVRRSTVSVAQASLQKEGLIQTRQGTITVLDRPGLEGAACECYRIVADEHRRLMD